MFAVLILFSSVLPKEEQGMLNITVINYSQSIKTILNMLILVLRLCQNSLQFEIHLMTIIHILSVFLNVKTSPVYEDIGLQMTVFDFLVSLIGLVNQDIYGDSFSLKFGFQSVLQLLKNRFVNFDGKDSKSMSQFLEYWAQNVERVEQRLARVFV